MFSKLRIACAFAVSVLFPATGFAETTNDLIVAHFKPAKTNYFWDEPIAVSLTIINQYTNTIHVSDNIKAEFKLCPGNGATDKTAGLNSRMVSMVVPLSPKGQLNKIFYINESLRFDKPGKYYVDCTFTIHGRDPGIKLLQPAQDISVQEAQDYLTGKKKELKRGEPGFCTPLPLGFTSSNAIAVKVAGRISFALVKASPEQLSNVYNQLLQKSRNIDPKNREDAVEAAMALCSVRNPFIVPYLIKSMMIPDLPAQQSIIQALEEIGTPEAINGITGLDLTNQKTMFLRQYAAEAIGRLKAKEGVPFLIKLLNDDRDYVQISAIQALGQIGDAQGIDAIQKKTRDFRGKVKDTAVEVLKKSSPTK